jgi:hypothetical protein
MKTLCGIGIAAVLVLGCTTSLAEEGPVMKAQPEDMQWWRESRFGMFVHWGPNGGL